ncbi:alanine-rich signal peptide protein [Ralstonia solanacearum]|nr:alanine-rich signal peptide protein [Ralstonia solanacearum]
MKLSALMFSMAALLAGSAYAQTPAAATAPATASGGVHAVCKDGTPYSGATLRGACRGHGGVDKKASAADAAPAANAPATSAAMPAADKVWANASTKVYHCPGDRYYGKTKQGAYMSEADAKAQGMRPSHGKACAK